MENRIPAVSEEKLISRSKSELETGEAKAEIVDELLHISEESTLTDFDMS